MYYNQFDPVWLQRFMEELGLLDQDGVICILRFRAQYFILLHLDLALGMQITSSLITNAKWLARVWVTVGRPQTQFDTSNE